MSPLLRKLSHLQDPEVFLLRLLDRVSSKLDRPISWVQTKRSGLATDIELTFHERIILRDYIFPLKSQSQSVIYDIGANIGDHSLALAKLSNVSQVVAFEPLPNAFSVLQRRSEHHTKIAIFNVALGNTNGVIPFYKHSDPVYSSPLPTSAQFSQDFPTHSPPTLINVPVRRLDDLRTEYDLPRPTLIKIDVQGYEGQVIDGAPDTLRIADWLQLELNIVSLYSGGNTFDEQYRQITSLGFALADIQHRYLGDGYPYIDNAGNALQVDALFARVPNR